MEELIGTVTIEEIAATATREEIIGTVTIVTVSSDWGERCRSIFL